MKKMLRDEARRVYREHGGHTDTAVECLAKLYAQPKYRSGALWQCANYLLMDVAHEVRTRLSGGVPKLQRPGDDADMAEYDEVTTRRGRWADWPLRRGLTVWRATREELLEQMELHEKQAGGHLKHAAFCRAVAQRLKPGEKVCDTLTEEQVHRIGERLLGKQAAA